MGLRVRASNGKFEQTIKTKGKVEGGLHQRPEFNVDLEHERPDLSLFPKHIWEDDLDVDVLNQQIEPLFSTHFERSRFVIEHIPSREQIEQGENEQKPDAIHDNPIQDNPSHENNQGGFPRAVCILRVPAMALVPLVQVHWLTTVC